MHLDDERHPVEASHRHDIAAEVEIEIFKEGRVDGVHGTADEKRLAIGCGPDDRSGRAIAALARLIFNEKRLAQAVRQPWGNDARRDVYRSARWKSTRSRTGCEDRLAPLRSKVGPGLR